MTDLLEQTRQVGLDRLPTASNGDGDSADSPPRQRPRARRYRRMVALVFLAAVVLALAVVGPHYYRYAMAHESTDDAFIEGHVVPISPKVASQVARVLIDDNQHVNKGTLLVELDPRDLQAQLAQARANLGAAEAEAVRARADARRYEELLKGRAVSRQDVDAAVAKDRTAGAQIAQFQAAVREAELNLSYARIVAPETGRITRKNVEPGSYVQVGQTLFSIVPDRLWVIANFKENQLRYMRPGQPAEIRVDAYPDQVLRGHVDSIQRGSGARFSLLPPENATGNYVKVVQRVPVKIVFDEPPDPSRPLGPGMSVEPTVKVK